MPSITRTITMRRCLVVMVILSYLLHIHNINVAHSFLGPESYHSYARRPPCPQITTSCMSIRPEKKHITMKNNIINHDSSRITATTTTTTTTTTEAERFSLSQIIDDLWANERGGGKEVEEEDEGEEVSLLSSSTTIDTYDDDAISIIQDSSASSDSINTKFILIGGTVLILIAAWTLAATLGNELGIDLEFGELMKDPSNSLENILKSLETMDAQKGMIYFSSFYVLAEILAIPAVPILTASSGYLFGLLPGTATCLLSAVIAASISFVIGRTCLRGYVESILADNPKFRAMDRAIDKGGFKLMFITRLSPLFPFALSNYLFGASSIQFPNYFFGTLFGFFPGTFAYVYAGSVGKALTIDNASSKPWYIYLGGMAVIIFLLKIAGDVASSVIDSLEDETGDGSEGGAGSS